MDNLQKISRFYYDLSQASSFSSQRKIETAAQERVPSKGKIWNCLSGLSHDTRTLHRTERKKFSQESLHGE